MGLLRVGVLNFHCYFVTLDGCIVNGEKLALFLDQKAYSFLIVFKTKIWFKLGLNYSVFPKV